MSSTVAVCHTVPSGAGKRCAMEWALQMTPTRVFIRQWRLVKAWAGQRIRTSPRPVVINAGIRLLSVVRYPRAVPLVKAPLWVSLHLGLEFFTFRLNSITHHSWLQSLHIPDTLPLPEATKSTYGAIALRWKRETTT